MIDVRKLSTGYGSKQVIFDLDISIPAGGIVALIGPNGAGKSTLLRAVFGLLPAWSGLITYDGENVADVSPAHLVSRGLVLTLQGGRAFDELTVQENLEVSGINLHMDALRKQIAHVFEFFPSLAAYRSRQARHLSGGEQQMLAIARVLIPKPRCILMDEPSLGLSPNLVQSLLGKVKNINNEFDVTILIVEQKVRDVLAICDHVYALKLGQLSYAGNPEGLLTKKDRIRDLFL